MFYCHYIYINTLLFNGNVSPIHLVFIRVFSLSLQAVDLVLVLVLEV